MMLSPKLTILFLVSIVNGAAHAGVTFSAPKEQSEHAQQIQNFDNFAAALDVFKQKIEFGERVTEVHVFAAAHRNGISQNRLRVLLGSVEKKDNVDAYSVVDSTRLQDFFLAAKEGRKYRQESLEKERSLFSQTNNR